MAQQASCAKIFHMKSKGPGKSGILFVCDHAILLVYINSSCSILSLSSTRNKSTVVYILFSLKILHIINDTPYIAIRRQASTDKGKYFENYSTVVSVHQVDIFSLFSTRLILFELGHYKPRETPIHFLSLPGYQLT